MKTLAIIGLMGALAACAPTGKPDALAVERSAALARNIHASGCREVINAHTAGTLTGANFNKARLLCLQADQLMDLADTALLLGDTIAAQNYINQANALRPQLEQK